MLLLRWKVHGKQKIVISRRSLLEKLLEQKGKTSLSFAQIHLNSYCYAKQRKGAIHKAQNLALLGADVSGNSFKDCQYLYFSTRFL